MQRHTSIAVVGGGAAGLVAAHTLGELGFKRITLFEKEARVGGKVHSVIEDDHVFEMGAVWVGRDYSTVESLAKQFGVALVSDHVELVIRNKAGRDQTMLDFFRGDHRPQALLSNILAWQRVRKKFAYHKQVGSFFQPLEPDLTLPFAEFAKIYGIDLIAAAFRPFWVGCGYQYFDKVPALYVLKLMFFFDFSWRVFFAQLFAGKQRREHRLRQIVGGYQHLWERVAASIPDVRLAHTVETIVRTQTGSGSNIQITANGQTSEFDAVIVALDVKSLRRCLQMTAEERAVFNQVKTYSYVTRLCEVEGMQQYCGKMMLLDEYSTADTIGHVTSFICRHERPRILFTSQLVAAGQSEGESTEILRTDLAALGGRLINVRRSQVWDYLPHAESEALSRGFYDQLSALQGQQHTWFVGGLMNFESVEATAAFARQSMSAWS